MKLNSDSIPRIAQVTQMYSYQLWGYGEAIAMDALLEAADVTGQEDFRTFVRRCLDLWAVNRPKLSAPDHVAPGSALLKLYELYGEEPMLDRAVQLGEVLVGSPRSFQGARIHRPEKNDWLWVDCLYTDLSFLFRLTEVTGDDRYAQVGQEHAREYLEVLFDPDHGWFYHGCDGKSGKTSPYFWGRGNGWALLGIVDLLTFRASGLEERETMERFLVRLLDQFAETQDESGNWHTIINYPESSLEPSIAAMVAAALLKARALRCIEDRYEATLAQAIQAIQRNLREGGRFPVSEATAVGDFDYYDGLGLGIFPWGQGPVLMVACRLAGRN